MIKLFFEFNDNEATHLKTLEHDQEFLIKQNELEMHIRRHEDMLLGTYGASLKMGGGPPHIFFQIPQADIKANQPIYAATTNNRNNFF